jgi:UDP-N-acetylglucosamine/UDP-N-acetylgalactosamine 4-epimerase
MIQGQPVEINGDGKTSRDFCYVANVVQANLLAATARAPGAANQVYNVAMHERTTLNDLFECCANASNHTTRISKKRQARPPGFPPG